MSEPVLIILMLSVVALLLTGVGGYYCQKRWRRHLALTAASLAGLSSFAAVSFLIAGGSAVMLRLPVGPPGLALSVVLDPLGAFFLVFLCLCGALLLIVAQDAGDGIAKPVFLLAGMIVSLLAADGFMLLMGLLIYAWAIWRGGGTKPPAFYTALMSEPAAGALALGVAPALGTYLLVRSMAGLGDASFGPVFGEPVFGIGLVCLGAVSSVLISWHSIHQNDAGAIAMLLVQRVSGLCLQALGVVLVARSIDLPHVAALASRALLLLAVGQMVCGGLLVLSAGLLIRGAGTSNLGRMGGLVHRMPYTSIGLIAGSIGLISIPPSVGFAGFWLLFQALIAMPMSGVLWPDGPIVLAIAALALSGVLALASTVRMIGVALLGRPRTPRGAAADEVAPVAARVVLIVIGLAVALGLLPTLLLTGLGEPAVQIMTNAGSVSPGNLVWLASGAGYAVLPVASVLGAICVIVWRARGKASASEPGPVWNDGFAPSPPWLPFGDPGSQTGGDGFVPVLRRITRISRPRVDATGVWLLLGTLLAILLGVAWIRPV